MAAFDIVITLITALLGVAIGAFVVALAGLLGIAGWLAGLVVALLVLALTVVHDKLFNFEMKHIVRLIARASKQDIREIEAAQREDDKTDSRSYYGFAVGTVLGIAISLIWSPERVFELLPL